jgi:hypothetical protein
VDLINVDTKNEETLKETKARVDNLVHEFKNSLLENSPQVEIKQGKSL